MAGTLAAVFVLTAPAVLRSACGSSRVMPVEWLVGLCFSSYADVILAVTSSISFE